MDSTKVLKVLRITLIVASTALKAYYIWKSHRDFERNEHGPSGRHRL